MKEIKSAPLTDEECREIDAEDSFFCLSPACGDGCGDCSSAISRVETIKYARRYAFLRNRPLTAIADGGVFAGKTPDNVVLNDTDLDAAIDAEMVMHPIDAAMLADKQADGYQQRAEAAALAHQIKTQDLGA